MKRTYIFLLALCGLAITASAAPKEQPDARYKLIRERYTVCTDGTTDYNCRKEITILRNRALTAYADKGETFIVYNPAFETLTINESYTLRKDGSRVETPKNAFVEQLPSSCQDCGRYNGLREMAIIHTAMEYGCTIVLDYTIHRKTNHLYATITPAQDCPVDRYELSVKVPQGQRIFFSSKDGYGQSLDIKTPRPDSLHLAVADMAQRYVDAYLPASGLYASLTVCNDEGTAPCLQWLHFDDAETCPAASVSLVMMMQDDKIAYAKAIHDYVVDNVTFNDVDAALTNWQVAPAAKTWQSNCGNAADKAQLLAALLRQAGFSAQAVSPTQVRFSVDDKEYFFSPIAQGDPQTALSVSTPAVPTFSLDTTYAWNGADLSSRYSQLTLPDAAHALLNAAYLTSCRTAPLALPAQKIDCLYRITLPAGAKLLSKAVRQQSKDGEKGRWDMSTDIRLSGNVLTVRRTLTINHPCLLSGKDYQSFRQALIDWQTAATLTLKK